MQDYIVVKIEDGNVESKFGNNTFTESIKQFIKDQEQEPSLGFKYPRKKV